jgi:prevent-host-death family protein
MKHVGMFEAKTNLSSLVDEVEKKGREVIITRHGKPVAKIVRVEERLSPEAIARRRQAFERLMEIRDRLNLNLTHEQIKAGIEEGRR